MLIIGIDAGANGGMAIIPLFAFHQTKAYQLADYSVYQLVNIFREIREGSKGPLADISEADQEYSKDTPVEVYLEEPSLNPYLPGKPCPVCKKRPMRNAQSYTTLNRSLGLLEGLCVAQNWRPNLLSPQKWQNGLGTSTGGDKNVSKKFAESAFPFLTRTSTKGIVSSRVTHAIADALLIALYGYLQYATHIPSSVRYTLSDKVLENARSKLDERPNVRTTAAGPTSSTRSPTRPNVPRKPTRPIR